MILYAVEYKGPITSDFWSIVTIHTNEEKARKAMNKYIENFAKNEKECQFRIKYIDTMDCLDEYGSIYDYEEYEDDFGYYNNEEE